MTSKCLHQKRKKIHQYENQPIYQCSSCYLCFTVKNRTNGRPKKLYDDYYKNEILWKFKFGLEYLIRAFRFFRAFKIFTLSPKSRSILDIGSGRGFMLYYLKKFYGFKRTAGTQLCQSAVNFSRKKLGLEIYNRDLLKIPFKKGEFEIISVWHVLEHVNQPEKYVEKISEVLAKKGKLIIEVPNYNSWTSKITGKYWLGLDLKYHLSFFTKKSLSKLLKKYKLKIKSIHTFSLEYSTFISASSLISWLTKTDHLFFEWLQTTRFKKAIIFHIILFISLCPICLIINVFLNPFNKGEVLLMVAEQ